VLSAADSLRITVHGRGAHGSMPQAAVDPVVLAATIVLRLQTVVARELPPGEPAVFTVGSLQAGTKSNVIPDAAELLVNLRTYGEATRTAMLDAIRRIVTAECQASRSPEDQPSNPPSTPAPRPWSHPRSPGYDLARPRDRRRLRRLGVRCLALS
jgi:hippurate hydrolase